MNYLKVRIYSILGVIGILCCYAGISTADFHIDSGTLPSSVWILCVIGILLIAPMAIYIIKGDFEYEGIM